MIAVVDTGRGNLLSVVSALHYLGAEAEVCEDARSLESADRVILPGVGAFPEGMTRLRRAGLPSALERFRASGRPILGICLGMQFLAERSFEHGETEGLGWFDAEVRRLEVGTMRVPHVGWNDVVVSGHHPLFAGLPSHADFYFVHSFQVVCRDSRDRLATVDYGGEVTAAISRGNVAATQFHPEKSQEFGLAFLGNFLQWEP